MKIYNKNKCKSYKKNKKYKIIKYKKLQKQMQVLKCQIHNSKIQAKKKVLKMNNKAILLFHNMI